MNNQNLNSVTNLEAVKLIALMLGWDNNGMVNNFVKDDVVYFLQNYCDDVSPKEFYRHLRLVAEVDPL